MATLIELINFHWERCECCGWLVLPVSLFSFRMPASFPRLFIDSTCNLLNMVTSYYRYIDESLKCVRADAEICVLSGCDFEIVPASKGQQFIYQCKRHRCCRLSHHSTAPTQHTHTLTHTRSHDEHEQ